ncbi:MAG: SAM-dependent methyltransferase, partial [Candidatus Omnitrophica bacterium]|nr:SAM-dependent methyltransferase [Candidatus Omnitrophota bacterium]
MKCRFCRTLISEPFLSLGWQPLANHFLTREELEQKQVFYPLDVYLCPRCHLVQINKYVSPKE